MTAKNQNFEMYAGDTKTIEITCGFDITGASVKWAMKRSPKASNDVSKDTVSGGISISDAAGGVFTISIAPSDTATLVGDYYHEAEVTDQQGNVSTVTVGKATILQSGV